MFAFGRCQNSKQSWVQAFQAVYLRRKTFRSCTPNDSIENLKTNFFREYLANTTTLTFPKFVAVMFRAEGIPCKPSDSSSSHPKNNVFWVHMRFFWHKSENLQTKAFWVLRFWSGTGRTFFLNFLVQPCRIAEPFSGLKILKESRDCLEFWQRPNVSLTFTVPWKNIKKWRSLCRVQEISIPDER